LSLSKTSKAVQDIGLGVAALGVGIAAVSVKMATDFQSSLTTLVTGAGESESAIKGVGAGRHTLSLNRVRTTTAPSSPGKSRPSRGYRARCATSSSTTTWGSGMVRYDDLVFGGQTRPTASGSC
jgi:hypothetical protein